MSIRLAIAAVLAMTTTSACGPSRQGGYPSYEAVVSQYIPPGAYVGEPLGDGLPRPHGSVCDCPRIWYESRWVYYYHGHWIYWHHGYWYYYPHFYVYYWNGVPYVYRAPHYGIHKTGAAAAGPAVVAPPGHPAHGRTGPSTSQRDAPPAPSRGGGDERAAPSREGGSGRRR